MKNKIASMLKKVGERSADLPVRGPCVPVSNYQPKMPASLREKHSKKQGE